jgi:hypothetical protein
LQYNHFEGLAMAAEDKQKKGIPEPGATVPGGDPSSAAPLMAELAVITKWAAQNRALLNAASQQAALAGAAYKAIAPVLGLNTPPSSKPAKPKKPRGRNPRPGVEARQEKAQQRRLDAAPWMESATKKAGEKFAQTGEALHEKDLLEIAIAGGAPADLKRTHALYTHWKATLRLEWVYRRPKK